MREPWSKVLWEVTHVLKLEGSNPSAAYLMDFFHIFLVKIVMFV